MTQSHLNKSTTAVYIAVKKQQMLSHTIIEQKNCENEILEVSDHLANLKEMTYFIHIQKLVDHMLAL